MIEKKLNIGMFGLGTVGSGVYNYLEKEKKSLYEKHGIIPIIKKIVVKDIHKKRSISLPKGILSSDYKSILDDSSIDMVIEVMGGEQAYNSVILPALRNKKHVISANKGVVSSHADKIVKEARRNSVFFGFKATLTGCNLLLDQLARFVTCKSIIGILNSTSNFILSKMGENSLSLGDSLSLAQQLGYAEADPSDDIDGIDTKNKLILLSQLAFNIGLTNKQMGEIKLEGIRDIDLNDIVYAKELEPSYKIKLLGIAEKKGNQFNIVVHPCLVPKNCDIGRADGVNNYLHIDDEIRGQSGINAPGAGAGPTASAIVADIIGVASDRAIAWPEQIVAAKLMNFRSNEYKYYIRFAAVNKPGVLAKITSILAKKDINIVSVLQKPNEENGAVPVIVLTDKAIEKNVQSAKKELDKLDILHKPVKLIRVYEMPS